MNPPLVKQQVVLEEYVDDDYEVTFQRFENDEVAAELTVLRAVWVGMGRPDKVTVTVEPGDTLNG